MTTLAVWLAAAYGRSALPLVGAWLVACLLSRRSAALRHHVWAVALLAALLAPALALVAPRLPLPLTVPAGLEAPLAGNQPTAHVERPALGEPTSPWEAVTQHSPTFLRAMPSLVLLVWAGGAVALLLVRLRRQRALARIVAGAEPLGAYPDVRGHESVRVPLLAGMRTPTILLPAAAASWPNGELEAVVSHERAHAARHDQVVALAAEALKIVYWLNPLAWRAARIIELERERACDDEVLRAGVKASVYAAALLRVIEGLPARPEPLGLVAASGAWGVEARLHRILASARTSSGGKLPLSWRWTAILVAACAVVAAGVEVPGRASTLVNAEQDQEASGARELSGRDVAALIAALRAPEAAVRRQAAWELGERRERSAVEPLRNLLTDADAGVRGQAAQSLGDVADAAAVPDLIDLLQDPRPAVRHRAAHALGDCRDSRALDALGLAAEDSTPVVASTARWALQQVAEHLTESELLSALDHAHAVVREAAAFEAGDRRMREALPRLRALIEDRDPRVRERARWALGEIRE